jgi:hypothetical protein
MKKYFIFGLFLVCGMLLGTAAFAGTLSVGAQGWYVNWDSGLAKMNAQVVETQLRRELDAAKNDGTFTEFVNYQGLDVGDPESSGFLAGPRISYQTEDRQWEFRLSSMLFGAYSTSVDTSVMVTADFLAPLPDIATSLPISTDFEIEYRDIDLRVTRMITNNFGVFGGAIYQSYSSELESNYSFSFSTQSMTSSVKFKLDAWMAMLYAGISYQRPLGRMFSFTGNIGAGTPVAGGLEQELSINYNINGTTNKNEISSDGGEVKMAFMGFAEIAIGMKLGENVALELGYQYRRLTVKVDKVDLNADGNADESTSETDVFQGVTFAASYLLNL